jgi:hypothetical protein
MLKLQSIKCPTSMTENIKKKEKIGADYGTNLS